MILKISSTKGGNKGEIETDIQVYNCECSSLSHFSSKDHSKKERQPTVSPLFQRQVVSFLAFRDVGQNVCLSPRLVFLNVNVRSQRRVSSLLFQNEESIFVRIVPH